MTKSKETKVKIKKRSNISNLNIEKELSKINLKIEGLGKLDNKKESSKSETAPEKHFSQEVSNDSFREARLNFQPASFPSSAPSPIPKNRENLENQVKESSESKKISSAVAEEAREITYVQPPPKYASNYSTARDYELRKVNVNPDIDVTGGSLMRKNPEQEIDSTTRFTAWQRHNLFANETRQMSETRMPVTEEDYKINAPMRRREKDRLPFEA